jgi:hypothetical protein
MRAVRLSIESPDDITASAVSARDQIGRAVADKIRNMQSVEEFKTVVNEVLPEIEKFLESPEERRLRAIRGGVITSVTGAGAALLSLLVLFAARDVELANFMMGGIGLGITTFLIGLGVILNALFFMLPRKQLPASDASQNRLSLPDGQVSTSQPVDSGTSVPSVTEHTTKHLSSKRS